MQGVADIIAVRSKEVICIIRFTYRRINEIETERIHLSNVIMLENIYAREKIEVAYVNTIRNSL